MWTKEKECLVISMIYIFLFHTPLTCFRMRTTSCTYIKHLRLFHIGKYKVETQSPFTQTTLKQILHKRP